MAQQDLLRGITERGELQQERLGDYQQNLQYIQGIQNADWANWQNEVGGRQYPFNVLPGLAGGTYGQGYIPEQSQFGSTLGALGGLGAAGLMGANPWLGLMAGGMFGSLF